MFHHHHHLKLSMFKNQRLHFVPQSENKTLSIIHVLPESPPFTTSYITWLGNIFNMSVLGFFFKSLTFNNSGWLFYALFLFSSVFSKLSYFLAESFLVASSPEAPSTPISKDRIRLIRAKVYGRVLYQESVNTKALMQERA